MPAYRFVRAFTAVLVMMLIGCVKHVSPARPLPNGVPPTSAANTSSWIDVPVTVELQTTFAAIESAVPAAFGTGNWDGADNHSRNYIDVPNKPNVKYRAYVTRTPIRISGTANTVTAETDVTYHIDLQALNFLGLGHCKDATFHATLTSSFGITPSWTLTSHSRGTLAPGAPCNFNILGAGIYKPDVTKAVQDFVQGQFDAAAAQLDRLVANVDVRGPAEKVWAAAQQPISVAPNIWVLIHPAAFRASNVSISGTTLNGSLGLEAAPVVFAGANPPPFAPTPLPSLELLPPGNAFVVQVDGILDYDTASRLVRQELVGSRFRDPNPRTRQYIEIKDARLGARGDHAAILEISFEAGRSGFVGFLLGMFDRKVKGTAYLTGSPTYDLLSETISISNLDIDARTDSVLANTLVWLKRSELRDFVRTKAQWSMHDAFQQAKLALAKIIDNQSIAPGVFMRGQMQTVKGIATAATPAGLVARVEVIGSMAVSWTPGPVVVPAVFRP